MKIVDGIYVAEWGDIGKWVVVGEATVFICSDEFPFPPERG